MSVSPRRVLIAAGALIAVVGTLLLSGFIVMVRSAPKPLTVPSVRPSATVRATAPPTVANICPTPSVTPIASGINGVWMVQPGSVAGYRARERLAGVPTPEVAVARTDQVAGWGAVHEDGSGSIVLIDGCFAVDLRALRSQDEIPGFNMRERDNNVQGFLNTSEHPFGLLRIDSAQLGAAVRSQATAAITGQLEVNGIMLPASFTVQLQRNRNQIGVAGSAVVNVDDYHVEVPKDLNFIDVDPRITIEFAATLAQPAS
jgi:hypothetical protein